MENKQLLIAMISLERAGLNAPYRGELETRETLAIWARTLGDLEEEQLQAAIDRYLRSERGSYWPTPSELRRLVGFFPSAERLEEPIDWPGKRWAQLFPGEEGLAMLSQAIRENRETPACGASPCPPDYCEACSNAVMARCDELAEVAHLRKVLPFARGVL